MSKKPTLMGELLAEFFGTMILILMGDGVVANVGLAPRLASGAYNWNTIAFGWGLAVMTAVYVTGGVSGAHINPAVTFALAIKKSLSWAKVIPYWIAQTFGAFVGAFGVWLAYHDGLVAAGMPNVWATGPGSIFGEAFWGGATSAAAMGTYSLGNAFIAEVIGTMVLVLGVLAMGDSKNLAVKSNIGPFMVGMLVTAIGLTLGGPSGYAINPARDLGPRLFGAVAGTPGLFDGSYWFIAPILGPLVGAAIAVAFYAIFVSKHLPDNNE
ncbi:MAG: glycerol uptake facilitator protein [Thermosipho sp. (in: thermotogales)]|nr:glycerol uptake facilitator protein [Thermosipho sp. (in: thermotogales)]